MIWGSLSPVDIASVCFLSQWQQRMKIALAETHPEESQIKHHYSPGKYCEEISSPPTAEEMRDEAPFPDALWSTLNQALLQENGGRRGGRQLLQPPPRSHRVNVWTHQKHAKCIQMCNKQEPTCRTNRHPSCWAFNEASCIYQGAWWGVAICQVSKKPLCLLHRTSNRNGRSLAARGYILFALWGSCFTIYAEKKKKSIKHGRGHKMTVVHLTCYRRCSASPTILIHIIELQLLCEW